MDIIFDHIKNNPGAIAGVCLVIFSLINSKHAAEQQDAAFNMPEDSDTEKICRQIRLLETRVWILGHLIVMSIGLILVFIGYK